MVVRKDKIENIYEGIWLPWWLSDKESAYQAGNSGSIPGLGRSPGEGDGNSFLYSCLENSMDRGVWWATVQGVVKNWTGPNTHTHRKNKSKFH